MSDDLEQALEFLRAERVHEEQALFVSIHTGAGLEHVWTLLDHIAALEARNRELEFKWESKEPGTQGSILDAFYEVVETFPEYNPVMSEGHLNVLRKHLAALELQPLGWRQKADSQTRLAQIWERLCQDERKDNRKLEAVAEVANKALTVWQTLTQDQQVATSMDLIAAMKELQWSLAALEPGETNNARQSED